MLARVLFICTLVVGPIFGGGCAANLSFTSHVRPPVHLVYGGCGHNLTWYDFSRDRDYEFAQDLDADLSSPPVRRIESCGQLNVALNNAPSSHNDEQP